MAGAVLLNVGATGHIAIGPTVKWLFYDFRW